MVSLLTRIQSGVHHSLGITFSVFVDNGGQKRGQTSRPVVRAKIQTNCSFKAHLLHGSNHKNGPTSRHVVGTEMKEIVTLRRTYLILAIVWTDSMSIR